MSFYTHQMSLRQEDHSTPKPLSGQQGLARMWVPREHSAAHCGPAPPGHLAKKVVN